MRYSEQFKQTVINDYYQSTPAISCREIARRFQIPHIMLQRWIKQFPRSLMIRKDVHNKDQNWTVEEKFDAVVQFLALSKDLQGAFLLKHGLYSHDIKKWKSEMLKGFNASKKIQELENKNSGLTELCDAVKKKWNINMDEE